MTKNKNWIIATLVFMGFTMFTGSFLISTNVSADDVVDNVNINVPVSCSLEGTGMTSHNANIVNGTYQADIGSTTLKAFCNDNNGFAIYAIGFTDDEYGKTVLTNNTLGTSADIATGTATSGSTSNWAMKLATNTSATYALTLDNGFGSYSSVPATYTKVAHRDSGTDTGTSATGSELTSTYAAYMNQTQPAGTYTGQVKYTLVHPSNEEPLQPQPATAGCINYFANASTSIGEMGCQSASNNASVDLWASNFKRDGYGFAGWNDKYDYSGTNYGPNQTITAPADVQTNGLSLYAVWIKSAGTIQNWNGCTNLTQAPTDGTATLSSVTALTDERDSNTYAVARLADGKCWMIENLRLDNNPELSASNTHNPSLPLNNSWWYSADNDSNTIPISNHLSITTDPAQTTWCTTDSSNCDDQSMLATNNTTLFTGNSSASYSASSNVYSYGNYYNWYSATAGHGKYGSNYDNGYHAPGDICPAGWHLPTGSGDTSAEYRILDTSMGGTGTSQYIQEATNKWRSFPNNFVFSGNVSGVSIQDRGNYGKYWSSTASADNTVHSLGFHSSYVGPGRNTANKNDGRMVRCVAGV